MKRTSKGLYGLLISGVFSLAIFAGCGGGGGGGGTTTSPPTGQKLSGIAAKGAAIVSVTVTVKDKNGLTKTITTGTDGKYEIDVTGMTAPFLLKVPAGTNYLYSVATATGTVNIHPFTDLIIRNWYKVQGSDVETDFSGTSALLKVPTATEINTIEVVVRNILSTSLTNAGITTSNFNLLTSPFDANSAGFDKVLDNTNVAVSTDGAVTVTATDPTTGISGTMVSTNLTTNLTTADTTKPSDPTGLVAVPANTTSILLAWNASTDNIGVSGYNVYRGGSKVGSSPYPVYSDTGLTSGNYCYQVEAFDGAGNISANKSSEVCATPAADATAPSAPTGLTATAASSSQINLSWTASASTDVIGYAIYRGGTKITAVTGTSYSDTSLSSNTQYSYELKALDGAGNLSTGVTASATTSATPSTSSPTIVGTWNMSTENGVPVSGVTFVFNSSGNWSYTEGTTCTGSGTYSTSGSNLTFVTTTDSCPGTGDVFPKTNTGTYTVTATTLTTVLTNSTGGSGKTTVFTK